jgi:hypothetical protein
LTNIKRIRWTDWIKTKLLILGSLAEAEWFLDYTVQYTSAKKRKYCSEKALERLRLKESPQEG